MQGTDFAETLGCTIGGVSVRSALATLPGSLRPRGGGIPTCPPAPHRRDLDLRLPPGDFSLFHSRQEPSGCVSEAAVLLSSVLGEECP